MLVCALVGNAWLLDTEKCCSFLIGRVLGSMLLSRDGQLPEESKCEVWKSMFIFNNGLEADIDEEPDTYGESSTCGFEYNSSKLLVDWLEFYHFAIHDFQALPSP